MKIVYKSDVFKIGCNRDYWTLYCKNEQYFYPSLGQLLEDMLDIEVKLSAKEQGTLEELRETIKKANKEILDISEGWRKRLLRVKGSH